MPEDLKDWIRLILSKVDTVAQAQVEAAGTTANILTCLQYLVDTAARLEDLIESLPHHQESLLARNLSPLAQIQLIVTSLQDTIGVKERNTAPLLVMVRNQDAALASIKKSLLVFIPIFTSAVSALIQTIL